MQRIGRRGETTSGGKGEGGKGEEEEVEVEEVKGRRKEVGRRKVARRQVGQVEKVSLVLAVSAGMMSSCDVDGRAVEGVVQRSGGGDDDGREGENVKDARQ